MTVSEAVKYGADILADVGIDEAKNDAWLLFEYVTGLSRTEYFLYPKKELEEAHFEKYVRLIDKRSSHYPLQYITNVQQFMGYDFYVDESVLVPRPETELLVLKSEELVNCKEAKLIKSKVEDNVKVLDMCTGSGCIAISLKLRNPGFIVDAVDISDDALAVAKNNADRLNADIGLYKSDLFSKIPEKRYDIIVSNPPYIETAELQNLMAEVKDFEPLLALDGKEDGLYFYRNIIRKSAGYLKLDGKIIFEIGYNQADDVAILLKRAGFTHIDVIKDMSGLDRIVSGGIENV